MTSDWVEPGAVLFGRYRLVRALGEGALGRVFAGCDTKPGALAPDVVVTVLHPRHAVTGARVRGLVQWELGLLGLVHAAYPVAHLIRPREPGVRDERGIAATVVELVDGPSLAEIVARGGGMSAPAVARVGAGLARALAEVHAAGGRRCDLRVEGVRLRGGVEPVLLDLGLARAAAREGDASVLAPEEANGADASPAGDVFRLGALLRDLHASAAADRATTYRAPAGPATPVPAALARSIAACLHQDPARRPSAAAVALALAPVRRAPSGLAAGALVLVAGAAIAFTAGTKASTTASRAPSSPLSTTESPSQEAKPRPTPTSDAPVVPGAHFGPQRLPVGDEVTALALASRAPFALTARGDILMWWNGTPFKPAPVRVDPVPGTVSIASNGAAAIAVDRAGHAWTWRDDRPKPERLRGVTGARSVAFASDTAVFLLQGGTVAAIDLWETHEGGRSLTPDAVGWHERAATPVAGLNHITAISARGNRKHALRDDGTVWFWGEDSNMSGAGHVYGEPVLVGRLVNVVAVASGNTHSLALDSAGDVWAWGDDTYEQLGQASSPALVTPVKVPGLPKVKAIAAGMNNGLAIGVDGRVWEWGTAFGGNQVRDDRALESAHAPRPVDGLPRARSVASSGPLSFAVTEAGLWAWGSDD